MNTRKLILGVLLTFLLHSTGWSQALATSQVSGAITDQTGASVPNAQIKMTATETGQVHTVKSNSAGSYIIPDLPSGPYRLEVEMAGFSTYVQTGIVLEVGTNPQINVKLAVGTIDQKVMVEANALMVETVSNGIGQVIDQQQVVEMPLNGRDPTQLIALAGATTTAPSGDLNSNKNFPTVTLSVAGGLPNGMAYVLDGGSHNNPFNNLNLPIPFPDALQEFKVETSSLPAQYGDHASAAINAVTKSGGNTFHGDAFEFVRNYLFNAAPFFGYNSKTGVKTRDSLKRNQFGGVIGGPIIKDKLFFFGGYQGTIVRSSPPGTLAPVPTTAMMNGDFSVITSKACQAKGPYTLPAPFATVNGVPNQVDPHLFSSQALAAMKSIPVATAALDQTPGCGQIFINLPANYTQREALGRIDYTLSEKHRVFGRYFIGTNAQPVPGVPGNALDSNAVDQYNRDSSLTLGDTYSFTADLIDSTHLTARRTIGKRIVAPFFDPSTLGISAYTSVPGFLGLSVNNGISLGNGAINPGYFNTTSWQFVNDMSFIHGSHQITVGVDYIYALMDTVNTRPANGTYNFNGQYNGAGVIGYADFLLGTVFNLQQGNADLENDGQMYFATYAQDSWKANKRVTINYGLRWEPYTPEHNSNGRVENFSMADFIAGTKSSVFLNAPAGMSFQGDKGYPTNHYTFGKKDVFAPRVGVVFDPMGDGKMTIRAGYGIFYDSPQMFFDTRYSNSPPYGSTVSLPGPLSFANPWASYPGGNPFPGLSQVNANSPFPTAGIYVNSPLHIKPMYLQQWSLSIQRQIGTWLFAASYLGNNTKHLSTSYEANPAQYIAGTSTGVAGSCGPVMTTTALGLPKAGAPCSSTGNTNQRRLLFQMNPAQGQYYSTIGQYDDGGNANYNGLLVSAQHRGRNFNLVANYTLAHCLSEGETTELTGPSYLIPPSYDPRGRSYSYSNCDSDRRQVANVSGILKAPTFQNHLTEMFVGGWQVSTILTATSGGYTTGTLSPDYALSGEGNQIANIVGSPYGTRSRFGANGFLTSTAFTTTLPALGTYSTQKPLTLLMPGSYELDMALSRTIKVPKTDSQSVQLRWEVFNVPNEAIFNGNPAGSATGNTFGNFTSTANPRIMQFAGKYIF